MIFYIFTGIVLLFFSGFLLLLFLLLYMLPPLWHFSVGVTIVGGIDDIAAVFAVVVVVYVDS